MNKRLIFGTGFENNKSSFEKKKFLNSINYYLDLGLRYCDTADSYFKGDIQNLLSNFSKKKIIIINKFNYFDDLILLKKNLDNSLKRLKVEQIDYYMPHWPNFNINEDLLINFANYCLEKKKIKFFGLSNFNYNFVKKFYHKFQKNIAIQFELNMQNFFFNQKLIKFCHEKKIDMFCYGFNRYIPSEYINKIKKPDNRYDYTLKWVSSIKRVSPIIKSLNKKNIFKNFLNFSKPKKINLSKKFKIIKLSISEIKKINSGSGIVYKNLNDAKKNIFDLYPSPKEISLEIIKYGLLKPFYVKRIKYGFELIEGQARYWACKIIGNKLRKAECILVN